ncbi:unnamed protein product [Cunninghamella blakesleeana]
MLPLLQSMKSTSIKAASPSRLLRMAPVLNAKRTIVYQVASPIHLPPPHKENHHFGDLEQCFKDLESHVDSIVHDEAEAHVHPHGSNNIQVRRFIYMLETNAEKLRQLNQN